MSLPEENVVKFYEYLRAREIIRQRRLVDLPRDQWTRDPIFIANSFTNVKRHHDRTTMIFINEFYRDRFVSYDLSIRQMQSALMTSAVFRLFGTAETARLLGWVDVESWPDVQRRIMSYGVRDQLRFTGAYIVPNMGLSDPKYKVVAGILEAVCMNSARIVDSKYWETMCDKLMECKGIGPFLAKEVMLDYVLITRWRPLDWETWTPVGPGAARGASRVKYGFKTKIRGAESLEVIRELFACHRERWPLVINDELLGDVRMPDLELTDIQFALCEFDKYERVRLGEKDSTKNRFRPTRDDITTIRKMP